MRKGIYLGLLSAVLIFSSGCTSPSTKLAQAGSFRSQAVTDGVHNDVMNALSREQFETAKLNILLNTEKAKRVLPQEQWGAIDAVAKDSIASLSEFAQKRDMMMDWDRDHERANAYKYVTVDAKLFSEQGVLNYIAGRFSDGVKGVFESYDAAKEVWNGSMTKPAN